MFKVISLCLGGFEIDQTHPLAHILLSIVEPIAVAGGVIRFEQISLPGKSPGWDLHTVCLIYG